MLGPLSSFLWYLRLKVFAVFARTFGVRLPRLIATARGTGPEFVHPDRKILVPSSDHPENPRDNVPHHIKVHVYEPNSVRSKGVKKPLPVHLNWHGSGFIFNFFGDDSRFCRHLSSELDGYVLDADYRKAPEHPFPSALNDVEDVIRYVLSNPDVYDSTKISIGGFSAGAYLAIGISSTGVFDKNIFVALIAAYPPVFCDKSEQKKMTRRNRKGYPEKLDQRESAGMLLDQSTMDAFGDCYRAGLPEGGPKSDLFRKALLINTIPAEDFPPTLIISAEYDPLANEDEYLARKLLDVPAGGHEWVHVKDQGHYWDKMDKKGTRAEQAKEEVYGKIVQRLKEAYHDR